MADADKSAAEERALYLEDLRRYGQAAADARARQRQAARPIAQSPRTTADDVAAEPGVWAGDRMREAGVQPDIANYGMYQDLLGRYARSSVADPYQSTAGATRAQQIGALNAMRGRLGVSVSGMAGNIAQDQGLQAALRANAGRAGMAQAASGLGGMAADIGRSRLQEYLAAQSALGQGASAMRGADQQTMQDQFGSALGAQRLSNQRMVFGAGQGSELERARQQALLNQYRMYQALRLSRQQQNLQNAQAVAGAAGTVASAAATAAGGAK